MSDFSDIFLSNRQLIFEVLAKIAPISEVEDLLQETYERVHLLEDKNRIRNPAAFMMQIAKNLAFDYVKSAHYKTTCSLDEETLEHLDSIQPIFNSDTTLQNVVLQKDLEIFCKAAEKLSEKCRNVYIMRKIWGFSQKEIAKKEGIEISTVESHIAEATKKMYHFTKKYPDFLGNFTKPRKKKTLGSLKRRFF